MSIERTSPLKPVSTVQPRENSEPQAPKARPTETAAAGSASVTLSAPRQN